jgi:hypothetical protein
MWRYRSIVIFHDRENCFLNQACLDVFAQWIILGFVNRCVMRHLEQLLIKQSCRMLRLPKYIAFLIFFLQLGSCKNRQTQKQTLTKQTEVKALSNIFGLYSYFTTGYNSGCESVKHSLRLNNDSTFILKIYCYGDSASPSPVTVKTGKFAKEKDLVFNFLCTDNTSFKVEILTDSMIEIIPKKDEKESNYPFQRDTTTNEKFWQQKN